MKKNFLIAIFSIILTLWIMSSVHAEDTHVISNSENWKDVYSTVHYANLKKLGSDFLVSTRHGPLLLEGLSKSNSLLIVSSKKQPFVINYPDQIEGKGFAAAREINVDSANLDLIEELDNIENFIIVGDTYGYNAIAVAPYAVISDSWVFLADKSNIADIESILASRNVKKVLIYGYVDREVRDALARYSPEIINKGDRFSDNVEIVKKYISVKPVNQVVLTNGEFIEKELMVGLEPVLFTGRENVPDQIRDYLSSSDIEVGVLVGSELVGAATNIRRTTGMSVIVKFARGSRSPAGSISAVEGLDLFYLPAPLLNLTLYSVKYNQATSGLEVTYKSFSNTPLYLKGTIAIKPEQGETTRVGDLAAVFMAPNDFKTISYPDTTLEAGENIAEVFTLYGESENSLERILEASLKITNIQVIDNCQIEVQDAVYKKFKSQIVVYIKNSGKSTCWVDIELEDFKLDEDATTLGSDGAVMIKPGKKEKMILEQELSDSDIIDNPFVNILAYYGEREDSLVNTLQIRLPLKIETISATMIVLIVLIILIIMFVLFVWYRRRKEDDDFD